MVNEHAENPFATSSDSLADLKAVRFDRARSFPRPMRNKSIQKVFSFRNRLFPPREKSFARRIESFAIFLLTAVGDELILRRQMESPGAA
jgi:hypothetical protein